eukprot:m.1271007 g.1271007  ORF g.1271007 m.1271007 type:complete len:94 (-) comp24750_c0_seq8:1659-1940(-)
MWGSHQCNTSVSMFHARCTFMLGVQGNLCTKGCSTALSVYGVPLALNKHMELAVLCGTKNQDVGNGTIFGTIKALSRPPSVEGHVSSAAPIYT